MAVDMEVGMEVDMEDIVILAMEDIEAMLNLRFDIVLIALTWISSFSYD